MKTAFRPICIQIVLLAVVFAAGLQAAAPQLAYRWDSLRIGGGGFVSGVFASKSEPGLVYARTDVGGAYRWDEAREIWIPLTDWISEEDSGFMGVESLAIDEGSPNRLYLLVGISYFSEGRTAVLRSEDYGASFEVVEVTDQFRVHGNGMGRQNGERLQVDPVNGEILYSGSRWGGLFKSVDAGRSWERLEGLAVTETGNENGVHLVVIDPGSASEGACRTVLVGVSRYGENLYRSDDGGASFVPVAGAPTEFMPQRAALDGVGGMFVTYANGAGPHPHWNPALKEPCSAGQVWRYELATGAWTEVTPKGYGMAFGGVTVDAGNPQRVAVSTMNTWLPQESEGMRGDVIFVSEDGGSTWSNDVAEGFALDPNGLVWLEDKDQSIHWTGSLEFDVADSRRVWVTSGNGVYRTDDIAAPTTVWRAMAKGFEETVPEVLLSLPDGPLVSVIADFDGFRHVDPLQYAPIHRPRMGTTRGLANAGREPNSMLRVGRDQMFYSRDGGLSWTQTASMQGKYGRVAVSADFSVFLHAPEGAKAVYRSVDKGATWRRAAGFSLPNARVYADREDKDLFYAYGEGAFWRSDNGGRSFRRTAALPEKGNGVLCVVPERRGHVWVAANDGGLWRTVDAGKRFEQVASVGFCGAVGLGKAGPGAGYFTLYIWGEVDGTRGVYRSTDEGVSWARVNDDAHQYGGPGNGQFVVGDLTVFGRVYMSTAGRGIVFGEPAE